MKLGLKIKMAKLLWDYEILNNEFERIHNGKIYKTETLHAVNLISKNKRLFQKLQSAPDKQFFLDSIAKNIIVL